METLYTADIQCSVTDAPGKSAINTAGKAAKKRIYSTLLHCFDLAQLRLHIK